MEVTPADDGSAVASYPGFDGVKLNQIWLQRNWDVTVPSIAEGTLRTVPSVESPLYASDDYLKASICRKELYCRKRSCKRDGGKSDFSCKATKPRCDTA